MGKRKTVAQQTQEATFSRMIARTFEHRQSLLLMHALEQYAQMIDLMDARFPSEEARAEAAGARELYERVKVAHSIRQWLEADEEDEVKPAGPRVMEVRLSVCPQRRMDASHYRQDGSCRCGEEAAS